MAEDTAKIPLESLLINKNEEGAFNLWLVSNETGDVRLVLSPAVSIALIEIIANAMALQLEIDKIPEAERATFPLDIASNVIKGIGWFKALTPEELAAQQLNGAFGAAPAQKGN